MIFFERLKNKELRFWIQAKVQELSPNENGAIFVLEIVKMAKYSFDGSKIKGIMLIGDIKGNKTLRKWGSHSR